MNGFNFGNLDKLKETIRKHEPIYMSGIGIAGLICSVQLANRSENRRRVLKILAKHYGEPYQTRLMQEIHSNNWLKLHGYPMKRRKH